MDFSLGALANSLAFSLALSACKKISRDLIFLDFIVACVCKFFIVEYYKDWLNGLNR